MEEDTSRWSLLSLSKRLSNVCFLVPPICELAASVATPPKTMVFGTHRIQFSDSLKARLMMNFLTAVIGILSFVFERRTVVPCSGLSSTPASGRRKRGLPCPNQCRSTQVSLSSQELAILLARAVLDGRHSRWSLPSPSRGTEQRVLRHSDDTRIDDLLSGRSKKLWGLEILVPIFRIVREYPGNGSEISTCDQTRVVDDLSSKFWTCPDFRIVREYTLFFFFLTMTRSRRADTVQKNEH